MVSCVRGTGQTLSNVDDFVLEDDFCKFWSWFTCTPHCANYTICWRKRFLDVGDTKIPNFKNYLCGYLLRYAFFQIKGNHLQSS